MPRVVVKREDSGLANAAAACPVNAFRKNNGEMVIDPDICIDCGVCQGEVSEGTILDNTEATANDVEFNAKKAKAWKPAI